MRALVCRELGGEEKLALETLPSPPCGERQVRIRVRAAAVNYPDTLVIRGLYQIQPPLPFVPGHEVSGEVVEVGGAVRDLESGDRVLSLVGSGGFAEEVLATPPAQQVHRIPEGMPWDEAAALDLTYGTAVHALRRRGGLRAGESLLVLGASGGCGSAAVEVGRALGARVIAAASTEEKCRVAERLGADAVIRYTEEPLSERVKALTDGQGVDVLFDPVGGSLFRDALRCLAWNGRYLVIGFAGGDIPQLPLNLTILKSVSVVGVAYGASAFRAPAENRDDFDWLFHLYREGRIRPLVSARFPLERAADALRSVHERRAIGKVVVTFGGGS